MLSEPMTLYKLMNLYICLLYTSGGLESSLADADKRIGGLLVQVIRRLVGRALGEHAVLSLIHI